jgi:hypothetical protein
MKRGIDRSSPCLNWHFGFPILTTMARSLWLFFEAISQRLGLAQGNESGDSPTTQGPLTDAGFARRQTMTEAIKFIGVCQRPSAVLIRLFSKQASEDSKNQNMSL